MSVSDIERYHGRHSGCTLNHTDRLRKRVYELCSSWNRCLKMSCGTYKGRVSFTVSCVAFDKRGLDCATLETI